MAENVRVYLIDRAGPAANAFAIKVESREGVELVSGAAEVEEALQDISDTHPDVILVGTDVGGAGVVDAIERVLTVAGDGAVVALCTRDDKALVDAAIRAGASGSLDRTASAGETITALHVYRDRQRGQYVDMRLAEPPGQVAHAAKKAPKRKGWRLFGRRPKSAPWGPTADEAGAANGGEGDGGAGGGGEGDEGQGDGGEGDGSD